MHDVAIFGAGELGGLLAHVLARRDVARSILLVDVCGRVAAGKALDIMQASAIEGFAVRVSGSADISAAVGSAIIVLADAADGAEWQGDEGLQILERLSRIGADSVVMCADAAHRELVERGVSDLAFRPNRLFGTAPEALASSLRALVALEANYSVKDIALTVLGVPPDQTVVPWEAVTIGGFGASQVLAEPIRRRLDARLPSLWPPGPYALATAAAEALACIIGGSSRAFSCFVAPADRMGKRARTAALPVRLGTGGAVPVEVTSLSVSARIALDNAMLL